MKELFAIQQALTVPKKHHNKFGNFYYRKTEDIMEAVKKLCADHQCLLLVPFTVVYIEGRFYTKATAQLYNKDGLIAEAEGFAREPESKPKMSQEQVTGSSSSYARKYALSGLFAIDDEQDADTQDSTTTNETFFVEKINQVTNTTDLHVVYAEIKDMETKGIFNQFETGRLVEVVRTKDETLNGKGNTQ